MTAPVGLGVVGLGWWGGELAAAARRSGSSRVVTCYARTPGSREAFAAAHGCRTAGSVEELLADPEVAGVLVATPHSTHLDLIAAAAAAGKHVFVEKPLTLTLDEARQAVAAARQAGVTLQVGHHRRRFGATRRLRRLLDDGELGTPVALEGNLSGPIGFGGMARWRRNRQESPVGGMTAFGVHVVDTLHYLAGPVRRVSAFSRAVVGVADLDDVSVVALEHAAGPLATLATSIVVPKTGTVGLHGTDAVAWSLQDGARLAVQRRGEAEPRYADVEPGDAVAEQLDEFARCVRGEAVPETGGAEGAAVVAVLEAIDASARTGAAVEVARP